MASEMLLIPRDKWERMKQSSQEEEEKKQQQANKLLAEEEEAERVGEEDKMYGMLYKRLMSDIEKKMEGNTNTKKKGKSKEKKKKDVQKTISEDVQTAVEEENKEPVGYPPVRKQKKKRKRLPPPGIPEKKIALGKMEKRDISLEHVPAIQGWELHY